MKTHITEETSPNQSKERTDVDDPFNFIINTKIITNDFDMQAKIKSKNKNA